MRVRGVSVRSAISVIAAVVCRCGPLWAHAVPGDPDPGRAWYLMPGPLFSLAVPLVIREGAAATDQPPMLADVGVEVSLHRFVPTSRSIFGQFGYGAFGQVQVGSIEVQSGSFPGPSPHLRVAFGAQGSYGVLGAQGGLVTRTLGHDQATMLGAFIGVFLSFGFETASFQVELPMVNVGDGRSLPPMFVAALTLKWPITLEPARER